MKNLSFKEKAALIWALPASAALLIIVFIYNLIRFLLIGAFVYSGTAGAMSFIFLKIKQSGVRKKFEEIRLNDSFLANFDERN